MTDGRTDRRTDGRDARTHLKTESEGGVNAFIGMKDRYIMRREEVHVIMNLVEQLTRFYPRGRNGTRANSCPDPPFHDEREARN